MNGTLAALPAWADALCAFLLVAGAFFAFVGSLGLAKLSSFEKRLHGPTKAATLGVGGALLASIVYFAARDDAVYGHEFLVTLFVFVTAPISAHLMIKSALHLAGRDPRAPDIEARR
ncbi:MAG: monovalent cation/H+ antiporter subunit G [Betaproteobacteria bacterium]|nr:MAG: monovalent cation/H+ antiporter subunit G [Betaproteobacteria bacterium]